MHAVCLLATFCLFNLTGNSTHSFATADRAEVPPSRGVGIWIGFLEDTEYLDNRIILVRCLV